MTTNKDDFDDSHSDDELDYNLDFDHVSDAREISGEFAISDYKDEYSESILESKKVNRQAQEVHKKYNSSLISAIKNVQRTPKTGHEEFDEITSNYINQIAKILQTEQEISGSLEEELGNLKEEYDNLAQKHGELVQRAQELESELKDSQNNAHIFENRLKEEKFEHHKTELTLNKDRELRAEAEAKLKKCLEKMIQLKKLWQKEQKLRLVAEKNSQKVISSAKSTLKYVFDCKGPMDQVLED